MSDPQSARDGLHVTITTQINLSDRAVRLGCVVAIVALLVVGVALVVIGGPVPVGGLFGEVNEQTAKTK